MAVSPDDQYALIQIKDEWYDFYVRMEDKDCVLYGKIKGPNGETNPNFDDEVLVGCAFERHRSDRLFPEIVGVGVDDGDGKKYLIIKLEHLSE